MRIFQRLFGRGRRYDDLSVSIREHIEERTEELVEEGRPRKEAEQAARTAATRTTSDAGAKAHTDKSQATPKN